MKPVITAILELVLWLSFVLNTACMTCAPDGSGTMESSNHLTLRRCNAESVDCENVADIGFLGGFFPCPRRNGSSFEASKSISECDLLAAAAAHLAVERVNQDPDILPNITLIQKLYPIYVPSRRESQADDYEYYDVLAQIVCLLRSNSSVQLWGFIGPGDYPGLATFVASFSDTAGLITVSYDVTSSEPDKAATFYRTLPSDHATNIGRLSLINRFEWFRIATISSQERYYTQMGEGFISLYNQMQYEDKELWPTSFKDSPDSALREVYSRDINIIFGFFDSVTARQVLCRAKSNLVSADHAWILPAYYNPNWWRLPAEMDSDCSDEDMRDVLESVIFVDTVKYPPMDLSLDEFHSQLLSKALDLFPSLTEEDLKPYLLHSRATNAYDAVTLLAQSVGVAFDQSGDNCNNISAIQTAFEKVFMECEYCRFNSGCFLNKTETKKCQEFCGPEYTPGPNAAQFTQRTCPDTELRSDRLLNHYGQVSYSQFVGGEECIVGLLWNSDTKSSDGRIYTLEEDFDQKSCTLQMNVSHTLRNFINNSTHCPKTFQWKGSIDPPRSHHRLVYETPLYQMVIICLLTSVNFILAITFLVFNIVWRKNPDVKATSPWLNIILIVGVLLRLPIPLMDGLTQSSASGKYVKLIHPTICYFRDVGNYIGDVIFISLLVMKNWRLYRIFNNKNMKSIGKQLTDRWLLLGMCLWSLPIVFMLIIRLALDVQMEKKQPLNERLQIEQYVSCGDAKDWTWVILNTYLVLLLSILLGLSYVTSLIRSPNTFRREAVHSLLAVTVALALIPTLHVVGIFLIFTSSDSDSVKNLEPLLWIQFLDSVCVPILVMLILFGPSVYVIVKRYVKEKKERRSCEFVNRYHRLLKKKEDLMLQLSTVDEMKSKLLAERQNQSESSSGDNATSESRTDAAPNLMEKRDNLQTSTADHSKQESKSLQCMDTPFTSEALHVNLMSYSVKS